MIMLFFISPNKLDLNVVTSLMYQELPTYADA